MTDTYDPALNMHRLHGARDEGECAALDDDGRATCITRPGWRVTVADDVTRHNRYGDVGGVSRELLVSTDAVSWLLCSPHLGTALVLADESYGAPMLVEVWRG